LQDFVNSTGKFNSIVVKTLKPVLCFSHDGVPLKFKTKTCRHYSLTVRIFSAWFRPLLNQAQTIRHDELYCHKLCFLNFKGIPSREEPKTSFSVLTTIELNLLVEFTKLGTRRVPYNDLRNLASAG
jgi:hypothetical protein